MTTNDIVKSLNYYLISELKDYKGFLVGREFIEPLEHSLVKSYKVFKFEIYLHLKSNHRIFTFQSVNSLTDLSNDKSKDKILCNILTDIFINLKGIKEEVIKTINYVDSL